MTLDQMRKPDRVSQKRSELRDLKLTGREIGNSGKRYMSG